MNHVPPGLVALPQNFLHQFFGVLNGVDHAVAVPVGGFVADPGFEPHTESGAATESPAPGDA